MRRPPRCCCSLRGGTGPHVSDACRPLRVPPPDADIDRAAVTCKFRLQQEVNKATITNRLEDDGFHGPSMPREGAAARLPRGAARHLPAVARSCGDVFRGDAPSDGRHSVGGAQGDGAAIRGCMATITVSAGQQADGSSRPAGGKRPSWRHSSLSCQLGLLGRPSARAAPTAQLRLAVGLSRWAAPGPVGGCGMAV